MVNNPRCGEGEQGAGSCGIFGQFKIAPKNPDDFDGVSILGFLSIINVIRPRRSLVAIAGDGT